MTDPLAPGSFSHAIARLPDGLPIHYVAEGAGEVVVLLHGWPQTWYEWKHVIRPLAARYRVIAPDLRGAGDSGKPLTGYDKKTMARDILGLVDQLGVREFSVVGHDFGAVVAYAMAAQARDRVRALAVLEMAFPGFGLEDAIVMREEGGLWHMSFHMCPDVPEMLIAGRERAYLNYFYSNYTGNPSAVTAQDLDEFVRTYSSPGAMRASLNYYRQIFQDARDNREFATDKLTMPVLALGGSLSLGPFTGMSISQGAANVESGVIDQCGHWMPEEKPAELVDRLLPFLARAR